MRTNEFRVVGPPGCGKTTWLGERVDDVVERGRRPLVTSLTKAAAAEIGARKLPISFDCLGTLHSHCYHALGQPEIAEGREHIEAWNEANPEWTLSLGIKDGADLVEEDNLEPVQQTRGDLLMNEYQVHRGRMTTDEMKPLLRDFAEKWKAFKDENGRLDFTDLIEICYRDVAEAPGFPHTMLVDEAQDLDLLEMSLIRKWGDSCESIYIVGDPDQAIFTWRGADPSAFINVDIPEENRQVLSQSYRVPRAVHARAVRWIDQMEGRKRIQYHPRDHDGDVRQVMSSWQDSESVVEDLQRYLDRDMTVMILATCSYMLQPILKELRKTGTPFHNPFRRRNGAWNPLQRRRGQTSTSDRIRAFLRMSTAGVWSADEVNRWTEIVRVKGTMNAGNRKGVQQLLDDETGGVGWDDLMSVFTEEAVDAGLRGDIDWLKEQLTTAKKSSAESPMSIVRERGPEALMKPPAVTIGTVHCSPGDEKVFTTQGWVKIEDLDPSWHRLAGHRRNNNRMTWGGTNNPNTDGFHFQKSARDYSGKLVVIETERSKTRITTNHRIPVIFADNFFEKWCCYLMRKGEWWRIGACMTGHPGGIAGRLATERADAGWILSIHESREEALIAEATWQARYGIPGTVFRPAKERSLSTGQLEGVHEETKADVGPRAERLLRDTQLQIDQPLHVRTLQEDGQTRRNTGITFTAAAGNLTPMSGYVQVLVPKISFLKRMRKIGDTRSEPMTARISLEDFQGTVYGLDVPPHHHYVSGGAIVHNSVKGGEADVVYIFPDVSRAGMAEWIGSTDQQASVYRLFYVAMTRARDTLVIGRPVVNPYNGTVNAVNLN